MVVLFVYPSAVCAPNDTIVAGGERRALNSATIVANSTRVVAVFSHIVSKTTTSNGVSACVYDTADGTELWCTKKVREKTARLFWS